MCELVASVAQKVFDMTAATSISDDTPGAGASHATLKRILKP